MAARDDRPLDAAELLDLALLMAVHDRGESPDALQAKLAALAAPGFPADADAFARAAARLRDAGHVAEDARGRLRASELGRARAAELGARTPGSACDSTRVCLLLRLCLDGVMPAANRRILVQRLLAGAPAD